MALDPVKLLRQLIQIPSINPMGHDVRGPHIGEERLTNFLQKLVEDLGLPWIRQRFEQGRDNLVALLHGNPPIEQGGEFLLWDVHQDTVPVEGMTVDPFGGDLRGGRVYGRGASDVKGSMAAMLAAISRATDAKSQNLQRPTIAIVFSVNEECGFSGVETFTDLLPSSLERKNSVIVGGTISVAEMFPRLPDAAIVAEPTGFNVVVAHQGVVRWRCHAVGRAAHTSRPESGINAIYGMAKVVQAIEQHQVELRGNGPAHALCGRPSVCVSTIHGGVAVNTVPDRVTIEIDRRLGPEEDPPLAREKLIQHIARTAYIGECGVEQEPSFMQSRGLSDRNNKALAKNVADLAQKFGCAGKLVGEPYATDAAAIAATGIPTVVFGPGSIAQAHTADEFIEVEELQLGTEIFHKIATTGLR